MTFVVTDNCIKCKYTDCVEVCPVDCFYEGPNFLVIHPDECIDCALCEPECPAQAIFSEDEVPENMQEFIGFEQRAWRKSGRTSPRRRMPCPTPRNGTASPASSSIWSADTPRPANSGPFLWRRVKRQAKKGAGYYPAHSSVPRHHPDESPPWRRPFPDPSGLRVPCTQE